MSFGKELVQSAQEAQAIAVFVPEAEDLAGTPESHPTETGHGGSGD